METPLSRHVLCRVRLCPLRRGEKWQPASSSSSSLLFQAAGFTNFKGSQARKNPHTLASSAESSQRPEPQPTLRAVTGTEPPRQLLPVPAMCHPGDPSTPRDTRVTGPSSSAAPSPAESVNAQLVAARYKLSHIHLSLGNSRSRALGFPTCRSPSLERQVSPKGWVGGQDLQPHLQPSPERWGWSCPRHGQGGHPRETGGDGG